MVFPRLIDRDVRAVNVLDRGRSPRGGVDAKSAGVRKEIEDRFPRRQLPRQRAVLALIEKETGLLSRGWIDLESQPVFDDGCRGRSLADGLRLGGELFEAARRQIVVEVDQSRTQIAADDVD